jgi:NADPH:quinone reductase-like Zn-dependent oxidoreductase
VITVEDPVPRPGEVRVRVRAAEVIAVPWGNVLHLPEGPGFAEAAISMDAVLSPWHALRSRRQVERTGEASRRLVVEL